MLVGASKAVKIDPKLFPSHTNPREFNRLARVFWEHMLFDRLAALSGLEDTSPNVPVYRDQRQIEQFLTQGHIKYVSILIRVQFLFSESNGRFYSSGPAVFEIGVGRLIVSWTNSTSLYPATVPPAPAPP